MWNHNYYILVQLEKGREKVRLEIQLKEGNVPLKKRVVAWVLKCRTILNGENSENLGLRGPTLKMHPPQRACLAFCSRNDWPGAWKPEISKFTQEQQICS